MSGDLDVNCFVRFMFLLLFFFEELLISISTENCSAVPSANNHSSLILENQPRFIFILRSFSAKDVCVCVSGSTSVTLANNNNGKTTI